MVHCIAGMVHLKCIVSSFKLHFWKCFKAKKAKKLPKSGNFKKPQFIQLEPQHLTKFSLIFHFVWDILLVTYLFLVRSYSFKLCAIHQQFWKYLKVQNFMDQHNFEMNHSSNTMYHSWFTVLYCRLMGWL